MCSSSNSMLGFQPASALLLLVHQAMPHIIARL
jgi:hypothetical protein